MIIRRLKSSGGGIGILNLGGMMPRNEDGSLGPPPPPLMTNLLQDIRRAFAAGAFSPALLSALVLPDACGAVEYPDAPSPRNRNRYVQWYDQFVEPVRDDEFQFAGAAAWKVRNGMIHETGLRFTEFGFDRVVFLPPGPVTVGVGILRETGANKESAFVLDLATYIESLVSGAETWLSAIREDAQKQERLRSLIQHRPEGLPPFFIGVPVMF